MSFGVQKHPDGVVVDVKVMPRSQPAGLDGVRDGRLLVRVGAAPVDGEANGEVVKTVAKALGVSRSAVSIVSGERSRQKRLLIEGVTPDQVRAAAESGG